MAMPWNPEFVGADTYTRLKLFLNVYNGCTVGL